MKRNLFLSFIMLSSSFFVSQIFAQSLPQNNAIDLKIDLERVVQTISKRVADNYIELEDGYEKAKNKFGTGNLYKLIGNVMVKSEEKNDLLNTLVGQFNKEDINWQEVKNILNLLISINEVISNKSIPPVIKKMTSLSKSYFASKKDARELEESIGKFEANRKNLAFAENSKLKQFIALIDRELQNIKTAPPENSQPVAQVPLKPEPILETSPAPKLKPDLKLEFKANESVPNLVFIGPKGAIKSDLEKLAKKKIINLTTFAKSEDFDGKKPVIIFEDIPFQPFQNVSDIEFLIKILNIKNDFKRIYDTSKKRSKCPSIILENLDKGQFDVVNVIDNFKEEKLVKKSLLKTAESLVELKEDIENLISEGCSKDPKKKFFTASDCQLLKKYKDFIEKSVKGL